MGLSDIAQALAGPGNAQQLVSGPRRGGRNGHAKQAVTGVGTALEESHSGRRSQASKPDDNIAMGCLSAAE